MGLRILSSEYHTFCLVFLVMFCLCNSQDYSLSPMEIKEKEAIYSVIQGFVGKWWNGSDLYPDPCGWTPIQGVSCEQYDDSFWYVTAINLGPVFDNSLTCSHDAKFPEQLFNLKHLKVLSLYSCFISPSQNPVKLPFSNWDKFSDSLESLTLRSNPGLVGTIPSKFGSLRNLQSLVLSENGLTGKLPPSIGNLVRLRLCTVNYHQVLVNFENGLTVNCTEFEVGGKHGWVVPKSKEHDQMYNHWASQNRFRIGDAVVFRYKKDSVMAVTEEEYERCKSTHPMLFSNNGNTVVRFRGPGLFHFISGVSGHCERGQKIIIKVLHIMPATSPQSQPPNQNATKPHHIGGAAQITPMSLTTLAPFVLSFLGMLFA